MEERHEIHRSPRAAFRKTIAAVVPTMVHSGYELVTRNEPELLVFERSGRPPWVPVVCIVLFPIGLLALLVKRTERVVVTFDELGPEHTEMSVQGRAGRPVRQAFARIDSGR